MIEGSTWVYLATGIHHKQGVLAICVSLIREVYFCAILQYITIYLQNDHFRHVHITEATLNQLNGLYQVNIQYCIVSDMCGVCISLQLNTLFIKTGMNTEQGAVSAL